MRKTEGVGQGDSVDTWESVIGLSNLSGNDEMGHLHQSSQVIIMHHIFIINLLFDSSEHTPTLNIFHIVLNNNSMQFWQVLI